jgi:hypothetical protein
VGRLAAQLRDLVSNPQYAERAGAVAADLSGDGVEETIRILGAG